MRKPTAATTVATLLACLALVALTTGTAAAREQQLAGMRLGQHAINLLEIYGQPNGIVVGEGPALAVSAAQAGVGMPGGAMPGMPGAPAMMAPPGAQPGMPVGMPGPGAMPGMPPAGPGAMPGMPPGGPGAFPAGPGAAVAAPAAGAAGVATTAFPMWALAVWVDMDPMHVQWIYNQGPVVLGFVLDRDGYITSITVVAEKCNYARTAMWRPHQYIKLGDSFQRVLYRYGWPDEQITFDGTGGPGSLAGPASAAPAAMPGPEAMPGGPGMMPGGPGMMPGGPGMMPGGPGMMPGGPGAAPAAPAAVGAAPVDSVGGQISVSWSTSSRVYSRDVILRYTKHKNIDFTLHNMKVTRIHIWR